LKYRISSDFDVCTGFDGSIFMFLAKGETKGGSGGCFEEVKLTGKQRERTFFGVQPSNGLCLLNPECPHHIPIYIRLSDAVINVRIKTIQVKYKITLASIICEEGRGNVGK
jgi:hypothetical protein